MTNNVTQDWNAVISSAQQQITRLEADRKTTPAGAPTQEIDSRIAQLRADIANAQRQLTLQAGQTNSAVTVPASASPGNPTVATTTAPTVPTATSTVDPTVAEPAFGEDPLTAGVNPGLQADRADGVSVGSSSGLSGATTDAQSQSSAQDRANFEAFKDWRVKLSLAPGSKYLYNAPSPGILAPLKVTNGVVFPYTPQVAVTYSANYGATDIVHNNYKIYQYSNSSVDTVTITCDFTAQDTQEANYLLAVIHFFKSMTKMFYGQDKDPKNGTPPPLCYISGLGSFQFEEHPLAIQSFTYNLPNEVDYIRTATAVAASTTPAGVASATGASNSDASAARLQTTGVDSGGVAPPPSFPNDGGSASPTYVPTKIQLVINCIPIMSRNAVSNEFSLQKYATGELMLGKKNPFKGMW